MQWTIAILNPGNPVAPGSLGSPGNTSLQNALANSWPGHDHINFVETTQQVEHIDAAMIWSHNNEDFSSTLPVLAHLHASNIPTILISDCGDEYTGFTSGIGVIHVPSTTDPTTLAGLLAGMLHRQPEVSQLRSQVGLVKQMHGDLAEDLEKLQCELETAATVQREFMSPDTPPVHGMSFSALWRPAGIVSGDIYDVTRLDEDHVGVFVADAVGHGMSAGMLAMMLGRTLASHRTCGQGNAREPAEVMQALNDALLERRGQASRFATATYAIINCRTRVMRMAVAGHPPAMIVADDGSHQLLNSNGPLLGVFDDGEFGQDTVSLQTGDKVLLYSDGFETVFGNDSTHDDLAPHLATFHRYCLESDDSVVSQANARLEQIDRGSDDDDLTLLCLHATPDQAAPRLAA
jgi:serine phosphatase RsbU (regulator of sigma subunit)